MGTMEKVGVKNDTVTSFYAASSIKEKCIKIALQIHL